MKKTINIKLYKDNELTQEYKNINSIYNETISFNIDNTHTKITNTNFIRENDEYIFNIDLIQKEAYYILKEKNIKLDIEVYESSINRKEEIIEIIYKIETEEPVTKILIESE